MKHFNLELAKKGNKVCTVTGRDVEILKYDLKGETPLVGIIKENEKDIPTVWNKRGENENPFYDLKMVTTINEGWQNLYKTTKSKLCPMGIQSGRIWSTEKDARENAIAKNSSDYIATVHITWEE